MKNNAEFQQNKKNREVVESWQNAKKTGFGNEPTMDQATRAI